MYTNYCTKIFNQFCCHIYNNPWQKYTYLIGQNFIYRDYLPVSLSVKQYQEFIEKRINLFPNVLEGLETRFQASGAAGNDLWPVSGEMLHKG